MDAQSSLSPQLEGILLETIDRGVWATRERLKYGRAIHTLDEESRFLHPQPYSTNLDMRFDTLALFHQPGYAL